MILALALSFGLLMQERVPLDAHEAHLRAFVVDLDGTLMVEGWRISALRAGARDGPRDARTGTTAPIDPASGVVSLGGLVPGTYTVTAHGPQNVATPPRTVELVGGTVAEIELLYPASDPAREVTVTLHGEGPNGLVVWRTDGLVVEAIAPDGTETRLWPRPRSADVWACAPPGTGPWRVRASSDCHTEVVVEGVRRGRPTDIVLVGNAAIELSVVDAGSGASLERFDVDELAPHSGSLVARTLSRSTTPARTLGAARFEGLVPGSRELVVRAPGFAPRLVMLPTSFAAGATAELRVELVPEFVVRGRVLDADGTPMPGVAVSATRGHVALPPQTGAAPQFRRYGRVLGGSPDKSVISDAEGWFSFEGLWQAEHTLLADFGLGCTSEAIVSLPLPNFDPLGVAHGSVGLEHTESPRGVIVRAADGVSVLELRCPPRAEVEVVIDLPPAGLGSPELWVERGVESELRDAIELLAARDSRVQISTDGSLIVKRYGTSNPVLVTLAEERASQRRPRGAQVPLEVGADGRLSASFLILPGELSVHFAVRAPGPAALAARGQGSQGATVAGPIVVESRTLEATLGAPSRVHIDLRE